MQCPECGRRVRGKVIFCPYCGVRLPSDKHGLPKRRPEKALAVETKRLASNERPRQGLGSSSLLIAAMVFGVLIIVGAVVLGVYQGLRDRDRLDRLAASEHFDKGLAYLDGGQYELAIAELESALRLDPDNQAAESRIEEARSYLLAEPTPTSVVVLDTAATHYRNGLSLFERSLWDEAIAELETGLSLDPAYKRQEARDLLFRCYYNSGVQLASADRMEEALLRWDKALEIRPDDADVKRQQELVSLYLAGMGYWQADWELAIESFALLYGIQPDYEDVTQRLHQAHVSYGDQLFDAQDWCEAQAQYEEALDILASAEVTARRDDAAGRCASPEDPTGTPTATDATPAPPTGTFVGSFVEYQPTEGHLMMVRGHVYAADGKGAVGTRVQISAYDWSSVAVTDGAGLFSFDGLNNPLTYTLKLLDLAMRPLDVLTVEGKLAWVEFRETQ